MSVKGNVSGGTETEHLARKAGKLLVIVKGVVDGLSSKTVIAVTNAAQVEIGVPWKTERTRMSARIVIARGNERKSLPGWTLTFPAVQKPEF